MELVDKLKILTESGEIEWSYHSGYVTSFKNGKIRVKANGKIHLIYTDGDQEILDKYSKRLYRAARRQVKNKAERERRKKRKKLKNEIFGL